MADEQRQTEKRAVVKAPVPLGERVAAWTARAWRPAGTAVAVVLALLLTWHVVNGKNGLQVWHKKRAEDQQLQKDIQNLQQENARLRDRIEKLKSDPDAIEHEAREKLHYAKPGEVIYTLPAENK
ncbi:MAG: septum formation initiator family protein [Terracidiphilus sp.]|jgi:cell division protein FtsB